MNGNTKDAFPRDRTENPDRTVLILDYDGTLHDSMGIYEPAFRTAVSELEEKGWLEHRDYSAAEIRHWIGFSAGDMWKSFQPDFTSRQRETGSSRIGALMTEAIRAGRARLYPGTEETLEILAASYDLWFLSNCKISYMEAHRQMFGLDRWFVRYLCTEAYGFIAKEEILLQAADPDRRYIAVGDRAQDRQMAGRTGIPFVGCAYGFGTPEELAGADLCVETVGQLPEACGSLQGKRVKHPDRSKK